MIEIKQRLLKKDIERIRKISTCAAMFPKLGSEKTKGTKQ